MTEVFSEQMLRQAAAACFKNAQSHYEAAKLLVKHDYSSQAVALAVIGVEGFAKALVYAVAALMPSQRKALPDKIDNYHLKHRVASWAEGAQAMLSEGLAEGGYSRQERLALYLVELAREGVGQRFEDPRAARQEYEKLERELPGSLTTADVRPSSSRTNAPRSSGWCAPARRRPLRPRASSA